MNPEILTKYMTDRIFLSNIHGIWLQTIDSCAVFFADESNRQTITNLYNYGIKFDNFGEINIDDKLKYIRFAISGKFEISREQIIQKLVISGAEFCENITANVNLLIIWTDPSSKVKKADKYNIKKIYWLNGVLQELGVEFWVMGLFG